MSSKNQSFINKKTKRSKSSTSSNRSSDCSDNYIFSNSTNSFYTIKHIEKIEDFSKEMAKLNNPSYTTDSTFLMKNNFNKKLNDKQLLNKELKFADPIEKIKISQIFPLNIHRPFIRDDKFKKKMGNFFFSNSFVNKNTDEQILFDKIHTFNNCYYKQCNISDFCLNSSTHFPNNHNNIFYKINKKDDYVRCMKVFHDYGYGISHFYAPKGAGKSLLFRSLFVNYIDLSDINRYTPQMFFNMRLLNQIIHSTNPNNIKSIFLHEAYSLFKEMNEAINLMNEINFSENNLMKIILQTIEKAADKIKERKIVFVLDNYSYDYDEENILNKIKKLVLKKSKIFVQVIYDVKTEKDGEYFYININPKNNINHSYTQNIEKFYYFDSLKLFSVIKDFFEESEIPKDYEKIFGENVSFFFEYKTYQKEKNISFEDFTDKKKIEIKNEILNFYSRKNRYYLNEIYFIIENNVKINYYCDLLEYVPANYIKITFEPKIEFNRSIEDYIAGRFPQPKFYILGYSFPLIRNVFEEIINQKGFINMKITRFLELSPQTLEVNFNVEMINIFRNLIDKEDKFFEHKKKIKIFVEDILEKKQNNENQIYEKKEVIEKINRIEEYAQKIEEFKEINFNDYTCIAVFQHNFCRKAFDILFFTKEKEII